MERQPSRPRLKSSAPGTAAIAASSRGRTAGGGTIILTALSAVPDVLKHLGVDPSVVLAAAGIDPKRLQEPESSISYAAMGQLLTRCVALSRCPHFGLLVGARQGLSSLGVVGFLVQHSPDVGTGLKNLVAHMHHYQRGAVPTLASQGGITRLGYTIYQHHIESAEQIYDGAMAICTNILRALCGPAWKPDEVTFSHRRPADLRPYQQVFQAPLRFDADETCIAFPTAWLGQPVPGADPMLYRVLQRQAEQLDVRNGAGLAASLRGVVRALLVSGHCSADAAATLFGMHRRTLHRHLKTDGVTFGALVDEVRSDVALELLAEPTTPLDYIAATLGYAQPRAFSRAFSRWHGTTPARWRTDAGPSEAATPARSSSRAMSGRVATTDAAPTAPEGSVRIGGPAAIPHLLRELGADPNEVLASVGLDLSLFDDPDNPIPFPMLGRLLGACVARTGCRHFGLLVGQHGGPASLGLIGLLMRQSVDVGTALRRVILYLHLHDSGAVATLASQNGVARLAYAICEPGIESSDQITDGSMAIICNIMRFLCGPTWALTEVLFAHRRPADVRPYRRFFGAPVRFDREQTALVFPAALLDQRVPGADPYLQQLLLEEVRRLDGQSDVVFSAQVRRMLRASLITGKCSADQVAGSFAMHRQTLNRRLSAEGTTFEMLLAETRYDAARQLLDNADVPIPQIAGFLGYADATAFSRAFRRWSGTPPAKWRASARMPAKE